MAQQPAVLGQRELAPQRLSRDATERVGPDGRGEVGHLVTIAVVMPGDDRRQRALPRVGEHPGLAHAGDADRPHRYACGFRRCAQCVEGAAAQGLGVDLGTVRAGVPRRGGTAGSEHGAIGVVDHGLARRRADVETGECRHRAPAHCPNWVCMDMVAYCWSSRQAMKERHATGRHGRTRRSRRQTRRRCRGLQRDHARARRRHRGRCAAGGDSGDPAGQREHRGVSRRAASAERRAGRPGRPMPRCR